MTSRRKWEKKWQFYRRLAWTHFKATLWELLSLKENIYTKLNVYCWKLLLESYHASINTPPFNSLNWLFEFNKSFINEDKLYEWIV